MQNAKSGDLPDMKQEDCEQQDVEISDEVNFYSGKFAAFQYANLCLLHFTCKAARNLKNGQVSQFPIWQFLMVRHLDINCCMITEETCIATS